MVTHIRPSRPSFTCRHRPDFNGSSFPVQCPEPNQDHPSAQSPFARLGRYPSRRGISYRVSRHYPAFIAHTGSCARPKRSCRLRLSLFRQVFAACRHSLRRVGPSRRYLCESFSGCLDPYPGGSSGAFTRFFPDDIGLHQPGSGSALNDIRTATSVRRGFRGYSHSLMFRPPDLLATQIAPTAAFLSEPQAAVTFTSTHISVRYLPEQWIC